MFGVYEVDILPFPHQLCPSYTGCVRFRVRTVSRDVRALPVAVRGRRPGDGAGARPRLPARRVP